MVHWQGRYHVQLSTHVWVDLKCRTSAMKRGFIVKTIARRVCGLIKVGVYRAYSGVRNQGVHKTILFDCG